MKFLLCWLLVLIVWAVIVGVMGLKALIGFALGVIVVVAASLAVGIAAASAYDRGDEWDP
jgi:hypothetical protein